MVNSQITQDIINNLKLDLQVDKIPSVIPVINVSLRNKPIDIIESAIHNNATTTTLYTTPTKNDFYLTFAALMYKASSDASNATSHSLSVVINGTRKNLLILANTANLGTVTCSPVTFNAGNNPIKIDKGTTITIVSSGASANDKLAGSIAGFIDTVN